MENKVFTCFVIILLITVQQSTEVLQQDDLEFLQNAELISYKDVFSDEPPADLQCQYDEPDIPVNFTIICNFRSTRYPEIVFRWWAGYGCYGFLLPNLLNPEAKALDIKLCQFRNFHQSLRVPCILTNSSDGISGCYQFDIKSPVTNAAIRKVVSSDAGIRQWQRCCEESIKCCDFQGQLNGDADPNESCPATWDGWSCWGAEAAGEVSSQVCSEFAYSNSGPSCHHYSSKECFSNATWNVQTDYSTCGVTPRLVTRVHFHIGCLVVSTILAAPAVFILASYKRLRARRLALHRNLLASLLIRNIFVIISKATVILDELNTTSGETIMSRNEFPCKMLASFEKLASSAAFTCMLVDAIFLHRMIVAIFKRELNPVIVYSVATAATIIPVIIWISLMATMNDSNCWIVYSVSNIQWVLDGPRITMLALNTLFLIDILRILLTKLKKREHANQLSTSKATLFLMPLFGVQFLLTAWRPTTTDCAWEQTYYFFTYIMDGLQGIMVAVLYCYINKEVHALLKTTYQKTETAVSRFRSEVRERRPTGANLNNQNDRRQTFTTMIDNDQRPGLNTIQLPLNPPLQVRLGELEDTTAQHVDRPLPSAPSLKILEEDINNEKINDILVENMYSQNDVGKEFTLLDDTYSPSEDGFVTLDFENDIYTECINSEAKTNGDDKYNQCSSIIIDQSMNRKHKVQINDKNHDDFIEETLNTDNVNPLDWKNEIYPEFFDPQETKQPQKYNLVNNNSPEDYDIFPKMSEIHNQNNIYLNNSSASKKSLDNKYEDKPIDLPSNETSQRACNKLLSNTSDEVNLPKNSKQFSREYEEPFSSDDEEDRFQETIDFDHEANDDSITWDENFLPTDIVENIDALGIYQDVFNKYSKNQEDDDGTFEDCTDETSLDGFDNFNIEPSQLFSNRSESNKIFFVEECTEHFEKT